MQAAHQFIRRTLDRRAANDRADRDHHAAGFVQHIVNAGHRQDAANAHDWIAGRDQNRLGFFDCVQYAWSSFGRAGTDEFNVLHRIRTPAFDEIFLKV